MVVLQQRNISQTKCIKYTQRDKQRDGLCLGKKTKKKKKKKNPVFLFQVQAGTWSSTDGFAVCFSTHKPFLWMHSTCGGGDAVTKAYSSLESPRSDRLHSAAFGILIRDQGGTELPETRRPHRLCTLESSRISGHAFLSLCLLRERERERGVRERG